MRKVLLAVVALMTAVSASAQLTDATLLQGLRLNKQMVPTRTVPQVDLNAVESPVVNKVRKAPRRAPATIDLNSLVGNYIGIDYPRLDSVTINCTQASVSLVRGKLNTIQLEGMGGVNDTIQAEVNVQTGEIAIAPGQVFYSDPTYGDCCLYAFEVDDQRQLIKSMADSIKGIIMDGNIYITTPSIVIIESGNFAGGYFSDLYYDGNVLARPNGTMTQTRSANNGTTTTTSNVYIEEYIAPENVNDTVYYANVYNFGDYGVPVTVTLPRDSMAYILPQNVLYLGEEYGVFSPFGLDRFQNLLIDRISIDGVSDASALTFLSPWTLASLTGAWFGRHTNTVIQYTDGSKFIYPTATTAIRTLDADKQAVATTYVNAAGQRSTQPFRGLNIVVTRYADGTQSTHKVLR